jgi:hypothetical protein
MHGRGFHGPVNETFKGGFIIDDLHCPSTQDIRRPHNHGITDLFGDPPCLLEGGCCSIRRLDEAELIEEDLKTFPVLCPIDIVRSGSDDLCSFFFQRNCQIEWSLTSELHDDAIGFFLIDDVEDILKGEGFKVEFVRCVVVG